MPVSIVDGTVEEADLKRAKKGIAVFRTVRIRRPDGSEHRLVNQVVKQAVADQLQPGTEGRFYLFRAFDISGIHGVRTADGQKQFDFPSNNEKLFAILGPVMLLWCIVLIVAEGRVPLVGAAGAVLSAAAWYFMSRGRREATAQFYADNN